jgi:hypothetical protein
MVDLTFQRATLLVDRVFLWLLGMTLVGVLGGLGLAALLLRAWRRKQG